MKYSIRFIAVLLFLFLLSFAVKNTETVSLRYYFNYEWRAPLILMVLLFFFTGVIVGILSCLRKIVRQRREIITLKEERSTVDTYNKIS
ncbi:MAG: LapA family protein [Nitrosomonadaceae bacterium]|nr:LapA family protein [Nitrosomonadaceae bacterium]